MTENPLVVPPFYCPLDSAVHPEADEIAEHSVAYLDAFSLYWDSGQRDHIMSSAPWVLAAYQSPLVRRERAQIYSDFLVWTFSYDDEICDAPPGGLDPVEMARTNMQILRAVECTEVSLYPDNRYAAAAFDVRRRIDQLVGPAAGDRFVQLLSDHFGCEMRQAAYGTTGTRPTLDEMVMLRLGTGCTSLFPHLALLINDLDIRPEIIQDRPGRALVELATLLDGWDNEIYSFRAENLRAGNSLNIVDVLALENDWTPQYAAVQAAAMRDRMFSLYVRIRDDLATRSPHPFQAYGTVLDQYIRGHLDWVLETGRYRDSEGGATAVLSGWADTPADTSTEPLPIPAIAWWWEHDPARR